MHEAMLYDKIAENKVVCHLCGRQCTISEGKVGYCRVRKNVDGTLFSLVYGRACSAIPDPIEKKPLWHFHPGAVVMSIATVGCNFRCQFCLNWQISHEREIIGRSLPPQKVVEAALESGSSGISYTYTEPTIFFEYAYDTAKLAHEAGLFNTFVTNGYLTPQAVETIAPYLDAATVDFKGSGDPEFYRRYCDVQNVKPVYECLKAMKAADIHIEITNLLVTEVGDTKEGVETLARWIVNELGAETAFHLLRFYPHHKVRNLDPTPIPILEAAADVASRAGLKYVYLGNVPGHPAANTICANCGALLVERLGLRTLAVHTTREKRCPTCKLSVPIVFTSSQQTSD